ncbi:MAG: hypothetical protein HUJ91_07640, partial [Bacteroidales bacterium]|nr:hypothetical protein [Bacteroidales bacterium]
QAQNNSVIPIEVYDLEYLEPDHRATAAKVIGTVLEVATGGISDNSHAELVPQVNAAVRQAFSSMRRLVPVTVEPALMATGNITSIHTSTKSRVVERKDSKGNVYKSTVLDAEGSVAVTITLTELETGQQWTNNFSAYCSWSDYAKNETEAIKYALGRLSRDITRYYNNMFPLTANIIEKAKIKKNKMKEVYIDLGWANGIAPYVHFDIYSLSEIAGREVRTHLGRLNVIEVLGNDISLCKVTSGKQELLNALSSDTPLLIVSNE